MQDASELPGGNIRGFWRREHDLGCVDGRRHRLFSWRARTIRGRDAHSRSMTIQPQRLGSDLMGIPSWTRDAHRAPRGDHLVDRTSQYVQSGRSPVGVRGLWRGEFRSV